jgi:circadian clock protein KaiB
MEEQGGNSTNDNSRYRLKLYITGTTPVSARAVVNVRRLCEQYLPDLCDLEIIDVFQNPLLAKEVELIAVPTLVKEWPLPVRRFIGDMSRTDRLVAGMDLKRIA